MNLQYIHNRGDLEQSIMSGTVAFEVPTREFLDHLFKSHSTHALFKVGISIKSDKDTFVKSIGRQMAEKRMTYVKFELDTIQQDGTTHIYRFFTNDVIHDRDRYHVSIRLTTVVESDNVRLINAHIDETIQ